MRRRLPCTLAFATLAAAGLAACFAEPAVDVVEEDPATTEDALTGLNLTCQGPAMRFNVSPGINGGPDQGSLREWMDQSTFDCRPVTSPASDAGADTRPSGRDASASPRDAGAPAAVVVHCLERPTAFRAQRYTIDLTRSPSGVFAGVLRRGEDAGPDVTLTCTGGVVDAGSRPDGAGPVPTYAEVKPIIDRTCGRCHTGVYDSIPEIKSRRTQILNAITSGRMPRGASSWRTSPDGRKVLDFLQNGEELR